MSSRVGQRLDDLQLLDDRAGPAVRDNQRQRVLMLGTDVQEVNVDAIDLGDELRIRIDPRFHLAPVVFMGPVLRELLDGSQRHTLREIRNRLPFWKSRRDDALAQVDEIRFWNSHPEGTQQASTAHRMA